MPRFELLQAFLLVYPQAKLLFTPPAGGLLRRTFVPWHFSLSPRPGLLISRLGQLGRRQVISMLFKGRTIW